MRQQGFHFAPQFLVSCAGISDKRRPLATLDLERGVIQVLNSTPALRIHAF
jgi:hypothetical protein